MSEHKTKEEILSEITGWGIHDLIHYPHKCKIKAETALRAMQLYADQQTSLFTQQLADKIKVEFSDECINEKLRTPDVKSGMIEMRDEILNRLK